MVALRAVMPRSLRYISPESWLWVRLRSWSRLLCFPVDPRSRSTSTGYRGDRPRVEILPGLGSGSLSLPRPLFRSGSHGTQHRLERANSGGDLPWRPRGRRAGSPHRDYRSPRTSRAIPGTGRSPTTRASSSRRSLAGVVHELLLRRLGDAALFRTRHDRGSVFYASTLLLGGSCSRFGHGHPSDVVKATLSELRFKPGCAGPARDG